MSEDEAKTRNEPWERRWTGLLWAVVGFGAGTGMMAPLVPAIEPRDRVIGGIIYGGLPPALVGLAYGLRRARKANASLGEGDHV